MLATRRLYVYLITFISLFTLLVSVSNLLRLLLELFLDPTGNDYSNSNYYREQFSLFGALLVVSGSVWLIHWFLAQRLVNSARAGSVQERQSPQRKLFIYATLLFTLWSGLNALAGLIQNLLTLLLSSQNYRAGSIATQAAALVVFGLAWFYHWRVRQTDVTLVAEQMPGTGLRRWYFYLTCYAALSIGIYTLSDLVHYFWWQISVENFHTPSFNWLTSDIAFLLVFFGVWYWHWAWSQRLLENSVEEQRDILPAFYLYAVLFQTVWAALNNLANFIYMGLRTFIGTNPTGYNETLGRALGNAFLTTVVYGLFWAYHRRVLLRREKFSSAVQNTWETTLGHIYYYLLALGGLVQISVGLLYLLQSLLNFGLGGFVATESNWRSWGDQVSQFVTLFLVGGPLWYFTWKKLHGSTSKMTNSAFRQPVIRRIYLYLILFGSVLTLLIGLAVVVYQLFLSIGTNFSSFQPGVVSWALAASIVAGVNLVYHLRVMREDQKASPNTPTQVLVPVPGPSLPEARFAPIQDKMPVASLVFVWNYGQGNQSYPDPHKLQEVLPGAVCFTAYNLTTEEVGAWLNWRNMNNQTLRPDAPPQPFVQQA